MTERNRHTLLELRKLPGNDRCADCGAANPEWASANLGIFLCMKCCGVHRCIGVPISVVKSLLLDSWTDEKLKGMVHGGNILCNEKYEHSVPDCYKRPDEHCSDVLREQWIRAKYQRQEFCVGASRPKYMTDEKKGILMKKAKDRNEWNPRYFTLCRKTDSFTYFIKADDKEPKDQWLLSKINVVFADEKTGRANSLQVTNTIAGKTRNLFISADTGEEIVAWYLTIRYIKLEMLKAANPEMDTKKLAKLTTTDFLRESKLRKKGPKERDVYKERWVTLDCRRITYLENATDAFAKGEIVLGSKEDGYKVTTDCSDPPYGFGFEVHTPLRLFEFGADTKEDRDEWVTLIEAAIQSELSRDDKKALQINQEIKRKSISTSLPRKLSLKAGLL